MKKYRIRKGSLAWFVVENKTALDVFGTVLTIIIAFSAVSAFANSESGQVIEEPKKVAEIAKESFTGYNVPLDIELQKYIEEQSTEKGIEPELVMAVIGVESNYNSEAIGDNGRSYGLMQVQTEWHQARIERLKSPDMLNPYDNVTVGIDILAEKISKDKGIEWALMAYNGGNSHADMMQQTGQLSEYAETVIKLWQELKGGAA